MTIWKRGTLASLAVLCAIASPAFAHVGVGEVSHFSSGFLHPLVGLDHVLAMIAVGLYASQLGGRNIWLVPLAFIVAMMLGGQLGYAGFRLPHVEQGIGISIVVMGLAIAAGFELPTAAAMALVGAFALFHGHAHGHAHGNEGAGLAVSFAPYAAGFVVATALLHCVGIGTGFGLRRFGGHSALILQRAVGMTGALAGVALLTG
jgi:urease accessory protein